jgi:hypothetical protein
MAKTDNKPLYKPFKNTGSGKAKYFVYVKTDSGGKRKIGFGYKGMDDWKSGTATKEQRKSFRARMKGIKKKDGSFAYKDKNSRAYWALNFLW